jgi:hypothetical protein
LKKHKKLKLFNKVTYMNQEDVDGVAAENLLASHEGLVAKFRKIDLPETIEMGDQGKVTVKLTNKGSAPVTGPVTIDLYISTDEIIDRAPNDELVNDALLISTVEEVNLPRGQSTTVKLDYANMTSVGAPGAYNLIAEINQNNTTKQISQLVSATGSDVVLDWNATALNAIQAEGKAGRGVAPTVGSRLLAITSLSVYDAVNAFDRTHTSYAVNTPAPVGASQEAAAAAAAHKALVTLLPNQTQLFDRQLALSLAEITDSPQAEAEGVVFGRLLTPSSPPAPTTVPATMPLTFPRTAITFGDRTLKAPTKAWQSAPTGAKSSPLLSPTPQPLPRTA